MTINLDKVLLQATFKRKAPVIKTLERRLSDLGFSNEISLFPTNVMWLNSLEGVKEFPRRRMFLSIFTPGFYNIEIDKTNNSLSLSFNALDREGAAYKYDLSKPEVQACKNLSGRATGQWITENSDGARHRERKNATIELLNEAQNIILCGLQPQYICNI